MFWCAHINETNFNRDGTILDDLRYKIEGKYDSTDVDIKVFLNDISKNKKKNCKSVLAEKSSQNYQVLMWRNVSALKESAHCNTKHKLLRKCRKCK